MMMLKKTKNLMLLLGTPSCTKTIGFTTRGKNISGSIDPVETERYAYQYDLTGDPKPALKGWSEYRFKTFETQQLSHPLDGDWLTKDVKSAAYAADYFQTSQSVHCSPPALDNFFPKESVLFTVKFSDEKFHAKAQDVYFKILIYLHQLLRYALFGMKVSGGEILDKRLLEELEALRSAN